MPKKKTQEEFERDFKKKFGDRLDISKFKYTGSKSKGKIICPIHGEFKKTPNEVMSTKYGCTDCSGLAKLTDEEFKRQANEKHGEGRYDYSRVNMSKGNNKTPQHIKCNLHDWWFEQSANAHLRKDGCPKCGGTYNHTNEEWIAQVRKVHNNFYSYPNTNYKNNRTKVLIECPIHGEFPQTPKQHMRGEGCNKCGRIKTETSIRTGFYNIPRAERHKEEWEKLERTLYFVRLHNEEESFYKIGITSEKQVRRRFIKVKDIYNIEVIKEYKTNAYQAAILEQVIKEENQQHKYVPKHNFPGHLECFNKNIIDN